VPSWPWIDSGGISPTLADTFFITLRTLLPVVTSAVLFD